MRLSTEPDRDEARALAVLHAAFDAGLSFLDTADAYCWDAADTGHNERLIARALAAWPGDRSRIRIATKGGLTRPDGHWVPDGRAKHLAAACAASLRALDRQRLHLYQLHAPDPRTPLSTSVRALASLRRDGLVERIGLCNVNVQQIEEARRITAIDAVQIEWSLWNDAALLGGIVDHCLTHGIELIAYRPLGGAERKRRVQRDRTLIAIADRHQASPFEIALAWLAGTPPSVVPIPGPTRVETVASIARAQGIVLTDEDRSRLPARTRPAAAPAARARDGEIVLIMGLPGAGKSRLAETWAARGYARLNRDESGGSLKSLLLDLARLIAAGRSRVVLDNTYVSRTSRAAVIQVAASHGLPVRCVWLSTSVEDAQVNAVSRMLAKYGRLLGPDEMRQVIKKDVSAFGPSVQFRYQRGLEPPDSSEGFSAIETIPFVRLPEGSRTNRALIVWCDGLTPARGSVLQRYARDGWRVLGLGWQPGVAEKTVSTGDVDAEYSRLRERIGVDLDVLYCPHAGGPPVCWCRKPLPGLGVVFVAKYQLDPRRCLYVGNGPQDPGFARRLGFPYRDAAEFFAP